MESLLIYLVVGAGAGIIAGMLGLGGGVVIVPALAILFDRAAFPPEIAMHMAIGTSLAVIVPTSVTSVYTHYRHNAILWPLFTKLTPGVALGALIGPQIALYLPGPFLTRMFGAFVTLVSVQIFLDKQRAPGSTDLPGPPALIATGTGIGALSAILGIGGGSLTVPFLTYCRVAIRNAVATSSAVGFVLALIGAIGFLQTGWSHPQTPPGSLGFVYGPAFFGLVVASMALAPVGAWLAHNIPTRLLKQIFALILGINGLRMLLAG